MVTDSVDISTKIRLANKKFKAGKLKEARDIYEGLAKSGVRTFEFLFSYGMFSKETRNYKLAKKILFFTIKNYPNRENTYIVLSELLRLEEKFKEAERLLILANNINPLNADIKYNLSLLYKILGDNTQAFFSINKAIELSPKKSIYKILKAEILMNKGEYKSAVNLISKIDNGESNILEIQIRVLLSQIYLNQKNFKKSEKILLELKKKYINEIFIYLNLSNLYFIQKDLNKGISILKEALKLAPEFIPLKFNLAVMYRNKGDIRKATKLFIEIVEINHKHFDSFFELSTIYDFSEHISLKNELLKVNMESLKPLDKIKVAFAKSNIYHRNKIYDKSSFFIKLANEEKLKLHPSDLDLKIKTGEFYKNLNLIENVCNKTDINNEQIIFIVGMPRSGSTLLESILSLNSESTDMGEVSFLEESLKEGKRFSDVFSIYKEKKDIFFKKNNFYTDKNLFNFLYIPIIYNFFPNAKIIHCTRDPLDNILSIYRTNFLNHTFSNSLIDISKLYVYQTKLMHIYRKEYGSIIYSYQHNNVVLNPYETIFDLINWLDWNWDDKYLSPNLSNRNVYTASSAQVREKITSKSLGKWKGYKELLTPAVEILSQNNLI